MSSTAAVNQTASGNVCNKGFLTQKELAERWHLSQSCVKNYRTEGKIPFFQLPGAKRVLYPLAEIEGIELENTKSNQKEEKERTNRTDKVRKMPEVSSTAEMKWRI